MMRTRLVFLTLLLATLPSLAHAVVKPPEEWFQQPGNAQLWQQTWPTLRDWEFKQQAPLAGPGTQSYDLIRQHIGEDVGQLAADMGTPADSSVALAQDLNHDGKIDQFDILELGYEVRPKNRHTSVAPPNGTNQICILRADFSDQNADYANYNVAYFDHRFFEHNATPYQSFRDYYNQVSYGAMEVDGTVDTSGTGGDGWYKGQQTRNYYRDTGGGDRILINEAVANADPNIDFSDFDMDHDGYVDCLMLFYPNAEFAGNLWPHRSSGLNIHVDGVIIDAYFFTGYNTGADSWTMEISCHEYGHILGLPDLYDVDYSSNGIGRWSLMAYNYDGQHKCPSIDPWCKSQLGWVQPEVITHNVVGKSLPNFQQNSSVLKVWRNGKQEDQYFLLANYQQVLTDADRPDAGLLILHCDDSVGGSDQDNAQEYRKHVDVVSARGWLEGGTGSPTARDNLDKKADGSGGDLGGADCWKATGNATFNDTSNCDTKKNNYPSNPTDTELAVTNISAPASTMTMDITVDTASKPTCTITNPTSGTISGNAVQFDVTATPADGRTIDHVEFYCNGAYLGQDTSSPYSLTFDSRPIYNGAGRTVRAIAVDNVGDIDIDTKTVDVSNTAVSFPYGDDFSSGNIGAWAGYNYGGDRRWQYFASVSGQSQVAGIGSTSQGYDYNEHDELVSLRVDLTGATNPVARYKQRYRVRSGENTIKVFVTADNGQTLDFMRANTGSGTTWTPASISLADYIGQKISVVFRLDSSTLDRSTGDAGWWIDDFLVKDISQPPSVLTITPGDGATVGGVTTITVTASDDEGVASVEFYMDGDFLSVDNSSPFTYDWNSDWVFNGAHTFTATAVDADQQQGSASVDWTVNNTPLGVPWTEPWNSAPGNAWHIRDEGGGGSWFWNAGQGYGGGDGMKFGKSSGNYEDGEWDALISPTLNVGSLTDPAISFLHHYDFEQGYDFARLFITTNLSTWTQLGQWSQTNQSSWRPDGYRLDSYSGQAVKFIWFGESDTGVVRQGWWVDDFNLRSAPQITDVSPHRILRGQTPSVTVTGTGFGDNGAIEQSSIKLGSTTLSTTSWSDTQIVFTLPASATSNNLVVKRRGISSDNYWLQVVLPAGSIGGLGQL